MNRTNPHPRRPRAHPVSPEHSILATLSRHFNFRPSATYPVGAGDDCAVRRSRGDQTLVLTTDCMVEGTHFSRRWMSMREVGWRAMASNVSDCLSMGARPESALVELVFPSASQLAQNAHELYRGMSRACRAYGFPIIGGNLARGPCWMVSITMVGRMARGCSPVLRSGARPGDSIWVSGTPGSAAMGLSLLQRHGRARAGRISARCVRAHVAPQPPLTAALALASIEGVHAMIDISDGIAKEIRTVAFESKTGATIDAAQLRTAAPKAIAGVIDPLNAALHGGEDYELLVCAQPSLDVGSRMARLGVRFTCIGRVTRCASGVCIEDAGVRTPLEHGGWDHAAK